VERPKSLLKSESLAAGGDDMLVKILFYSAVLCAAIGVNSADGNLFFFFTAHLTMLTVGYTLHRREKRVKGASAPHLAASRAVAPAAKTKAA
jgi:hypothetical protein